MLHRAAREHDVDLSRSWVVGDMITDVEMAHAAGARGILLRTGYGHGQITYQRARWRVEPDVICDNLLDAARRIIAETRATRESGSGGS
jgi:D-glycero-D-manno-heptose 1,7-bisphosphate phosphatase